ncbi:hypothetical protein ABK040_007775 [Willaertia magna]
MSTSSSLDQTVSGLIELLHKDSDFKRVKNVKQLEDNCKKLIENQNIGIKNIIQQLTQKVDLVEEDIKRRSQEEGHNERMEIMRRELEDIQYSIENYEENLNDLDSKKQSLVDTLERVQQYENQIKEKFEQEIKEVKFKVALFNHVAPMGWNFETKGKTGYMVNSKSKEITSFDNNSKSQQECIESLWEIINTLVE